MSDGAKSIEIPGFEIVLELGRGGQSTVYEAIENSSGDRVAIKVLSSDLSEEHLFRFEREYEILRGLELDGVISVLKYGNVGGRFYLVLELVEGKSLKTILEAKRLPQHEAAQIVTSIARTLQKVHEANVIHRDLKPSNILKSADARYKLADFGLARRVDETTETTTGRIMGTYAYMSPEQALGDTSIDERSDVFSLGAMFYEMLVGDTPFADLSETRSNKPPRWSSRAKSIVSQDLKAICLKALEKNRRDRFQSAREFTDELERFSNQTPIRTRYGWRSETRRLCLLHPIAATAAVLTTLLFASVVFGSIAYATQYFRTAAALERAESNLAEAIRAIDFVGREVGTVELSGIPRMEKLQRKVLERAMEFTESLLEGNPEDHLTTWEVGLAYIRVGDMRRSLGDYQGAEEAYRDALEILRRASNDSRFQMDAQKGLTRVRYSLANLLIDSGHFDEAEVEIVRLSASLEMFPKKGVDDPEYLELHSGLLTLQGRKLVHEGQLDTAEPYYGQAVEERAKLAKAFPDNDGYTAELAKAHGTLASVLANVSRFSDAEREYRESIRLFRDVGNETEIGTSWRNLAILYRKTGQLEKAVNAYESGRQFLELMVLVYPESVRFRSELAGALHGMALCLFEQEKPKAALENMQRSVDLQKVVAKLVPENVAYRDQLRRQVYTLCQAYLENGEHAFAANNVGYALELATQPIDHVNAAMIFGACAELASEDERISESERQPLNRKYLERAIEILAAARIDTNFLQTHDGLAPLREYSGFKSLLEGDTSPVETNP